MAKRNAATFFISMLICIAIILAGDPEARAAAVGTLCASTNFYAGCERGVCDCDLITTQSSCYIYCLGQAALQGLAFARSTCNGNLCQCYCTPGTQCASTLYYQGCQNAYDGCVAYCQDQAQLQNLTYGGAFCDGDLCTCYCKAGSS